MIVPDIGNTTSATFTVTGVTPGEEDDRGQFWLVYGATARAFAEAGKVSVLNTWLHSLQRPKAEPGGYPLACIGIAWGLLDQQHAKLRSIQRN